MIVEHEGYNCGAVKADTIGLQTIFHTPSGNTYAIWKSAPYGPQASWFANVHPAVGGLTESRQVYPIRWFLEPREIADLLHL